MSFHNGPCEKLYFPEFGCGTMQSHCLHNQNSGWDGGVEVCKIHDYIPIQGGLMDLKSERHSRAVVVHSAGLRLPLARECRSTLDFGGRRPPVAPTVTRL